jgi:hypothetical protein
MKAADIVKALGGKMRTRSAGLACCPAHEDRSPSLSIADGEDGKILIRCFAGCEQVAVVAALRRLGLWPERTSDPPPISQAERERRRKYEVRREREQARRRAFIERAWQQTWATAQPARGSSIETWLRHRGIDPGKLDLDRMPLRWSRSCPRDDEVMPAMVGLMTTATTNEPCGIHRTFLLPDGSGKAAVDPVRMMLGNAGIIRLSPDDEVELGVGICEGIETGLSLLAAGWAPIWASGSLIGIRSFPILSGIECLTIFSDSKPHEIVGARVCAERWAKAGREAAVRIPGPGGDWNDALGRAAA